jgi:hypothetical protein
MIQVKWCGIPTQPAGKTQSTRCARGAGPGMSFSRAATLDCIIWVAPYGRAVIITLKEHWQLHKVSDERSSETPNIGIDPLNIRYNFSFTF